MAPTLLFPPPPDRMGCHLHTMTSRLPVLILSLLLAGLSGLVVPGHAQDDHDHDGNGDARDRRGERPSAMSEPQRIASWCRMLSFRQVRIQRWAFQKLVAIGDRVVDPAITALPEATTDGRQLLLLLLGGHASASALEAIVDTIRDDEQPAVVTEAAIRALVMQQAPELPGTLVRRLREAGPFEQLQLYEALARMPYGTSLPVLLDSPPPAPAEPETGTDDPLVLREAAIESNLRQIGQLMWQVAAWRSAVQSGAAMAVPVLRRAPEAVRELAEPVASALEAWRANSATLRSATDHRHRVRQVGMRLLIKLCDDHPALLYGHIAHDNYRLRSLALRMLRDSGHPMSMLATIRLVADHDPAIANLALAGLTSIGPVSPEQVLAVSRYCNRYQRNQLHRLASNFPEAEYLAWLRTERLRLREAVVPHMWQRSPHDMVAGRTFRRWLQVQNEWERYNRIWNEWWTEHGDTFLPRTRGLRLAEFEALLDRHR